MSDETEVETIDPDRRIDRRAAAVALIAAAGAVVAVTPKDAQADIGFGELVSGVTQAINDTIRAPIEGTFRQSIRIGDLLTTAYTLLAGLGIAPEYMRLLRCLLGAGGGMSFSFDACAALGEMIGGEGSMTRTSQIPTTMEELWHREARRTSAVMDEEATSAFDTYFRQVQESQAITASAAEGQDMLGMIDTENLTMLDVAAAGGSIIEVTARIGHLIYGTNQRLSQLIVSQNASQQTRGAQLMARQHEIYLDVLNRHRERGPTMVPVGGANPTVSGE